MYPPESIYAVCVILPSIGIVTVCLRFWVRTHCRPGLSVGIDDWLVLAGAVVVVCMAANQIIATAVGGLGRRTELGPDREPIVDTRTYLTIKINYPQDVIEKAAYGLIKLSILFFYRRVFASSSTVHRGTTIMIALIALWATAFLLASIFVCGAAPQQLWDRSTFYGKRAHDCGNTSMLLLWFAITDVVGDIAILALPFPRICRMRVSKRDKLGISAILLMGTLSTIAGIVRLGFVSEAFSANFGKSGDINGSATPPWTWTTIESSVGLIAACLPPLAPLIRRGPSISEIGESVRLALTPASSRKPSKQDPFAIPADLCVVQSPASMESSPTMSPAQDPDLEKARNAALNILDTRGLRGFTACGVQPSRGGSVVGLPTGLGLSGLGSDVGLADSRTCEVVEDVEKGRNSPPMA